MNKYPQFLAVGIVLFLAACAGLTNKSLESGGEKGIQSKALQKPAEFVIEPENLNVSIDGKVYEADNDQEDYSVLNVNGGIVETFNGEINDWWTGEGGKFTLEKEGGAIKVTGKKVGPRYDAFGRPYNGLDFSGGVALRVRARTEAEKSPILRIDLKDANGYVANGKVITNRIARGDKFTDYYFRYDHKLKQTYPDEKNVDAKSIKEIIFFLNPGGSPWTGTLFIDEIKAVPASEAMNAPVVKEIGSNGGFIDNFEEGPVSWWCSGNQKADSPDGKSLRVTATKAGPAYDAFGRSFDPINFNVASTIRVRAKVDAAEAPNVRLDIKDPNGFATNARPNIVKFDKGDQWTDYYFPFKGRFTQTWPNYKKVDPTQIVELLFMVNAGKSPWSGKLYIQEVEAILPLPEDKAAATGGKIIPESPSTLPGVMIENFEGGTDSWWMGSDKFGITSINDKMMQVTFKEVGPDYETFGKGFEVQDFNKTPILVVRAMVDGTQVPEVRADVKDGDGHVANISPIIIPFKTDGKFNDYFYDFRGKFSQTYPDNQTVNPGQIQELIFFINPGGKKVSGTVYIEDIKALTPEEFEKATKQ